MKEINNDIFVKFVSSTLSSEEMCKVGEALRKAGEFNSAMESAIAVYKTNMEYADDLLGREIEDSQNIGNSVDRNANGNDSIVAESESSTFKNESIMSNKFNFNKEEATKIGEHVARINSVNDSTLSFEETLENYYLTQFPGTFPEEAKEIVKKIRVGVDTFNNTLNEAVKSNGLAYVEKLRTLGEGKTNEEKYEIYVNFLTALTVLETSNIDSEAENAIESFDEIKGKIFKIKDSISEEELDDIISKVADALNNNTLAMSSAEMINQLIDKLPEGEDGAKEIIRNSEEDIKVKLATALATLICHQKGELESTNGADLTVEQITINVCCGIEEIRIVNDFKKGVLTVDNAIKLLKIVGGITLYLLLATVFFNVAANFGLFISGLMIGLFGTSTIITVVASIVGLLASIGLLGVAITDIIPDAIEWTGNAFDTAVKAWRETAWPYIKDSANSVIEWIERLLDQKKVESTEYSVEDNTVAIAPVTI